MTNEERDAAIQSIADKVSDIHGDMKVVKGKIDEHHRTLYGNGRPGLVERHNAVEEQQRKCPALQRSLLGNRIASRANWIQLVGTIVAFGALIIAIVAVFIK